MGRMKMMNSKTVGKENSLECIINNSIVHSPFNATVLWLLQGASLHECPYITM